MIPSDEQSEQVNRFLLKKERMQMMTYIFFWKCIQMVVPYLRNLILVIALSQFYLHLQRRKGGGCAVCCWRCVALLWSQWIPTPIHTNPLFVQGLAWQLQGSNDKECPIRFFRVIDGWTYTWMFNWHNFLPEASFSEQTRKQSNKCQFEG